MMWWLDAVFGGRGACMLAYRVRGMVVLLAVSQMLMVLWTLWLLREHADALMMDRGVAGLGSLAFPWVVGIAMDAVWRGVSRVSDGSRSWTAAAGRSGVPALFAAVHWALDGRLAGAMWHGWAIWGVLCLALCVSHRLGPSVLRRICFDGLHRHRAILVGTHSAVKRLAPMLDGQDHLGIQPVGWLGDANAGDAPASVPFRGSVNQLEEVLKAGDVHQVVVSTSMAGNAVIPDIVRTCERRGVRLFFAQDVHDGIDDGLHWDGAERWRFGALLNEPLQSPFNRFAKRCVDAVVSSAALLFGVLPLACIVWVMQRMQSPGPVFYRQTRHGIQNTPFSIWKFRTMHCGEVAASVQATRHDARVFPFGRWMRKHSIDELPQFINVLLGHMSVVGPRPHLVEHNHKFAIGEQRYHYRSFVKPGITGLAQVNGCRGEVSCEDDLRRRVFWDLKYVESWSLGMDLGLIMRTVKVVIHPPETAY